MADHESEDSGKLAQHFWSILGPRLAALGVDELFYRGLLGERDWEFVVKLHALMEAVVNACIDSAHLDERVGRFVLKRPLADRRKLAVEMESLAPEAGAFIDALSKLRNALVHDVRKVAFQLENSDPELRGLVKGCVDAARRYVLGSAEAKKSTPTFEAWAAEQPRQVPWMVAGHLIVFWKPERDTETGLSNLFQKPPSSPSDFRP